MKKTWKKLIVGIFAFALILSGMSLISVDGSEVYAAETNAEYYVQSYTGAEVSAYKAADTAPVPTPAEGSEEYNDWIFAGWFTNEACSSALGKTIDEGTTYYAKYVPAEVLSVKAQVTADTTVESTKSDMRLVATVDGTAYKKVGFEVYYNGSTKPVVISTKTVYSRIEAAKDGVEYGFSPNIFDIQSEYFVTATLKNIAKANFSKGFYIKPFWVTLDGTTSYGVSRYARVEDSYLNIVNVPVRLVSDATTATTGTINVAYDTTYFTYADVYGTASTPGYANGEVFDSVTVDGTTTAGTVAITGTAEAAQKVNGEVAHLRLQVKDGARLPKKNLFTVTSSDLTTGVVVTDSVYMNFANTTYVKADTTWYDENETEFVITTPDELYGLEDLVNTSGVTFQDCTIYLGSSIALNVADEATVATWVDGSADMTSVNKWVAIGKTSDYSFQGTFDGQMHAISGVYSVSSEWNSKYPGWRIGLFAHTTNATIQNLELINSFYDANYHVGSIASNATETKFSNIYSNAIIELTNYQTGGIVGTLTGGTVENCWFDGSIITNATDYGFAGGIVGVSQDTVTITNCLNTGDLTGARDVGGFIGDIQGATTMSDCLNVGSVTGTRSGYQNYTGVGVGRLEKTGSLQISETYSYTDETYTPIGKLDSGSSVTDGAGTTLTISDALTTFTDKTAYHGYDAIAGLSGLDFNNIWVVRQSDTPALANWTESDALYAPDTEWAGSGTEEDPWIIKTASELYGLAYNVNAGEPYTGKYFKLGANITVNSGTASRWEDEAPKYNWIPIGSTTDSKTFEGSFDGKGYTIKGLYTVSSDKGVGLFGKTVATSEVKNLKLLNSYIVGGEGTGAIVGWAGGNYDTLYSDAIITVNGNHAGGILGLINVAESSISNCWFDGSINQVGTTRQYAGGITSIIMANNVIFKNCINTGTITNNSTKANVYVGGLIGAVNNAAEISDCISAGDEAISVVSTAARVGSFTGHIGSASTVSNIYVTENIYGTTAIGNGVGNASTAPVVCDDLTGAKGYMNTYLTFDRHEEHLPESEQHDGAWVARTGDVPGLKSFVDADDRLELTNQNTYRGDTRWYDGNEDATSYTIDTAEELVGLEDLTNEGTSFEGKVIYLGADIAINAGSASDWYAGTGEAKLYNWIPIGNGDSIKFLGTFDGKGHTITGIYAEHAANGIGLFGRIADGSVVRDFKITNSYISGKSGVGSVCGWYAHGTIDTIYSEAIVHGNATSGGHYGGVLGLLGENATIKNCWFAGTIKSNYGYTGGIVGSVLTANTTIESCLSTGTVTGTYDIGGIVGRVTVASTIKDSFSKATLKSTSGSSWVGKIAGRIIGVEVACDRVYVLGSTGDLYKTPDTGTLTGTYAGVDDLTGGNAFLNTWLTFDRPELAEPTTGYWVAVADSTPVLKSFLGDAERVSLDGQYLYRADTRWYDAEATSYVIDTAEELIGFATLVNGGTSFADKTVQLGADIVVNTGNAEDWASGTNTEGLYPWAPIGTTTHPFDGNFNTDGDIHQISGIYAISSGSSSKTWYTGLFGYTSGASIRNLKLANSYSQGANYTGVIGYAENTEVDTIYSAGIVNINENGGSAGGGIVGQMASGTINNCWFDGQIASKGRFLGGILGIDGGVDSITNCLVTGSIGTTCTSGNIYTGGLLGLARTDVSISNCLVAARNMDTTNTGTYGSVIGSINDLDKTASPFVVTVTNVYALDGIGNTSATVGRTSYKGGTMTGAPVAGDYTDYKGYMNTDLDFDNAWVAMEESAPMLQVFAPADGRFDTTSWYTKAVADGDGNAAGTEANPYIIDTLADLYGLTKRVNAGNTFENQYIKLNESITANEGNPTDGGWAETAPYYVWTPIGCYSSYFKGNFDGGMNTISGLYATASGGSSRTTWYTGLFGFADSATIKNVSVEDSYFTAAYYAGAIVGWIENGTIDTVYSNAIAETTTGNAAVLVGAISGGTIENAWANGSATSPLYVGGITSFATNNATTIKHCLSTSTLHASNKQVAGIAGRVAAATTVEDCLSVGTVTSVNGNRGSIVGYVASGSLEMTSVYGYSESGVENGATGISGGKASGITVTGGTAITDLLAVYDTEAYDKLDSAYWTARVNDTPILSAFAEAGNYATAAAVGNTYAIDTDLAGSGTDADPYLITSAAELYGLAVLSQTNNFSGQVVALANDITVNTATIDKNNAEAVYYDWFPIGNATVPFAGTFKGNSHTISGLYKSYDNFDHWIGLFDTTADTSKLSNFRITNTFFLYEGTKADPTRMGSVAGEAYGTIENIYSDATLQSFGRGTGGIIGCSTSGGTSIAITNCWFNGTVIGTKEGSSPYMGGIVGIEGNANATISHCLVSGDVLGLDKRVGGLVGSVNNGTMTMTDCLFSGDITGGYTVNTGDYAGYEYVGQLIGAVEASSTGTTVTVNSSYGVNDYAPYDIGTKVVYNVTETTENEDGTTTTTVVDTIHPTVNGRGYVSKQYDRLIGYAGEAASLDYTNYWALAKEGTPILKYFADSADIYDGSQIDALLELDYWNSANVALAKAEEKGQGTYMLTISGSNLDAYNAYCAALEAGIFDAYGNDQSSDLNTEGVYNAIYTSANCGDSANDDWVVNVTYVDGTIYISIATGQPLSQHLKADSITAYSADDGYTTSGLTPTFHMLEEKYYSASSYVIQLSNGHLIVIDGGINTEAPYLFEYMQSLVPEGKKPIIEAWVLSHGHYDHVGAMMGIVQNASEYAGKVYLEGIYYNEASEVVLADYASADDPHHQYMGYIEKISSVFKTTKGGEAEIYRMYTGQRYTFDGVTMDIMLSQELITADDYTSTASNGAGDVFNETSTWNLFTINGKKLLTMGDASEASKARIVDMYSTSYLTVDVFTAMHHGKNINRLNNTGNDSFSKALTVTSVVMYPFTEDLTVTSDLVGYLVAARNKNFLNKMTNLGVATTYADGSTGTAEYFYYGQGTSVLTFGDTITAEVLAHNDWDVTN